MKPEHYIQAGYMLGGLLWLCLTIYLFWRYYSLLLYYRIPVSLFPTSLDWKQLWKICNDDKYVESHVEARIVLTLLILFFIAPVVLLWLFG